MTQATSANPVSALPAQGGMETILLNLAPIGVLMVLFYVLLIMPQQRRMREHARMLDALKVGDKVLTGGGLIGTIETLTNAEEATINLGSGVKVSALRSTLQLRPLDAPAPAVEKTDAKKKKKA